ncbi:Methyltransferase domain-containing protein [Haloechinothrix alba]|uniref:Methyltransferase domain-containing protein n=1 Tax=Haloechinothrix alba TaxID=664784 RepID=A0A238X7L5_9PSEU|nr:methyltransferase domain-containing protein [Haloechinothrix alba]SNR54608.1 Methyltransferase domain-containing protein [Haloechinothrix alba]
MPEAGEIFHAAHAEFATWSPRLWRPLGEITAAMSRPQPGERVLDACCGSGASALPAARAVGPDGSVDALDLAENLLRQGRREAEWHELAHLRFVNGDVTTWQPSEPYDLVQCCYGVFFFPDMDAGSRHLTSLLRPGGRFAVTTWLEGGMERIVPLANNAIGEVRPDLTESFTRPNFSERVNTVGKIRDWMGSLGLERITVETATYRQPLHPDDAWTLLLGAALRGLLDQLSPAELSDARRHFERGMHGAGMRELDASSLIAVGHTPG